jgi:acetolactate decarboxylase
MRTAITNTSVVVLALAVSLLHGSAHAAPVSNRITQTSTIDALLVGAYDGTMTCGELLTHGDCGIGTFDRLDGEMVVLDGCVYQVKADGKIYRPPAAMTTPFASVCAFAPDIVVAVTNVSDSAQVMAQLNARVPNQNVFCAIKIMGVFLRMRTRSVPAQQKPYPLLADVARTQPVFDMTNVTGVIVGFRSPPFVKGINVPGYHWHFLSADKSRGGHILDFALRAGACQVDVCDQLLLLLPAGGKGLAQLDLSKDRGAELERVEK